MKFQELMTLAGQIPKIHEKIEARKVGLDVEEILKPAKN